MLVGKEGEKGRTTEVMSVDKARNRVFVKEFYSVSGLSHSYAFQSLSLCVL